LESVCVSLIGPNLEKPQACGDTTDEFGRFLFDYVAAGTNVLTFYRKKPWPIKLSLPELYYPGVTERAKAQTFTLKRGDRVQNLKLVFKK